MLDDDSEHPLRTDSMRSMCCISLPAAAPWRGVPIGGPGHCHACDNPVGASAPLAGQGLEEEIQGPGGHRPQRST